MGSSYTPQGLIGSPLVNLSGTPTSGQVPTATSGTAATWQTPGGGGGSTQVPAWTFTAGAIGSGLFTTDNASIGSTTAIALSQSVLGNYNTFSSLQTPSYVAFTNSAGVVNSFLLTGVSDDGAGNISIAVTPIITSGNWSGKYTVSFLPANTSVAQSLNDGIVFGRQNIDAVDSWVSDAPIIAPKLRGSFYTENGGTFTLVAGVASVANGGVTANSIIIVTLQTAGGTRAGNPDIVPTATVGFDATGAVTDTSTYNYVIVELIPPA